MVVDVAVDVDVTVVEEGCEEGEGMYSVESAISFRQKEYEEEEIM